MPSATLFAADGTYVDIGSACQDIQPFIATSAYTTQSLLLLFDANGCPFGANVSCGVVYTRGALRSLGPWAGRVVSARRRDLPDGYP
jgi:hypothetical protein